jgi:hypothetical protein
MGIFPAAKPTYILLLRSAFVRAVMHSWTVLHSTTAQSAKPGEPTRDPGRRQAGGALTNALLGLGLIVEYARQQVLINLYEECSYGE